MKTSLSAVALILGALALASCATHKPAPVQEQGSSGGPETSGAQAPGQATGQALSEAERARQAQEAQLLAQNRVHFTFDSSAIDQDNRAIVEAHARYLVAHPGDKVRLEGNCDERGTREYNLALGERRAKSVAKLMEVLGVNAKLITTVSYGKEHPLCTQHDEACWRRNRRVDIVAQ